MELGVLGGSVAPRASTELEERHLGALSPSDAAPRTSGDAFPSRAAPATAMSDIPVWLMGELQQIYCLGSPRHPHPHQPPAPGCKSQSNKGVGTRCVPRCHISRQLYCLGLVLRAIEAAWGVQLQGWMPM